MATLKKYDLLGKEIGKVTIEDELLLPSANSQMVKDYIVAIRNNARQWSACTKTRAQVNHSNKKPHPQKGTGRARQGTLATPQYKGGGRAWGPKPKFDQHVRINRKERRAAIASMIADKIRSEQVHVLDFSSFDAPKTKKVAEFLKKADMGKKRILFLGEKSGGNESFVKSMRNIPKAKYLLAPNLNGYDIALCNALVVLGSAVEDLKAMLGKRGES